MERIGQRVQVYWPDEGEWFAGTARAFDEEEGYFVVYDDGDEQWEADVDQIRFQDEDVDVQGDDGGAREAEAVENAVCDEKDGDTEATSVEGEDAGILANRQVLTPPESPTGAYDDEAYEGGDSDAEVMPMPIPDAPTVAMKEDRGSVVDAEALSRADAIRDVLSDGDTSSEDEGSRRRWLPRVQDSPRPFRVREIGDLNDIDDELEQSIAVSEVPETSAVERRGSRPPPSSDQRLLPERGRLFGAVLRASALPLVNSRAAATQVKVSFAEARDTSGGVSSLMLRCKQALGSTPVAPPSANPAWIEEELEQDWSGDGGSAATACAASWHFQLDLVPPKPEAVPLWDRVLGDLVLAVYASEPGSQNVFLGQAVLSLTDLLHGLLSRSPSTTRHLRLMTRSGKPLASVVGGSGAAELVVTFVFVPTFAAELRQQHLTHSRSSSSTRSRDADVKSSDQRRRSEQKQSLKTNAKPWARPRQSTAPSKSASSGINRKRFEHQVAKENVAFAKRLEWQSVRRARLQADAKAQEKRRETPPQHGARRIGHKASSGINRSKFVALVSAENRVLNKRLEAIGAKTRSAATALHGSGFGGSEQDKALAVDKRQVRQLELDFRMQRAQTAYAQHHELVAEVTELQDDVAQLKQRTSELSRACSRLDATNRKARHSRDCLRVIAEKEAAAKQVKALPAPKQVAKPPSMSRGGSDALQRECEALETEREQLEAEKRRRREQLEAAEQKCARLGEDAKALEGSIRGVLAQRAFSRAIGGGKSGEERMKRRQRAKDLSSEEEQQWTLFQAHHELAKLHLAEQVLEQRAAAPTVAASARGARHANSAATAYLDGKIARTASKLEAQQAQADRWRREYEALVGSGAYETLRAQVQELQHLVFLCRSRGLTQRGGVDESQASRSRP